MVDLKEMYKENSFLNIQKKIKHDLINNNLDDIRNRKTVIQELRVKLGLKNLRFIGINDSWITEYDWIGYSEIEKFLFSIPHPVRAYKLWAEVFTGQPLYSWTNKLIWWSIRVEPTDMIVNLVPELVNQTVLLENSKRYFKMEGFSGNDHFIKGIVAEFKRNFVCTLNMNFLGLIKKRQYRDLRKDLFRQFYGVYENNKFRKLLYRKQKPALYMLKYPKFKLHASWVRIYNETNRSHAWRGDKGAQKVKKFFNSFPFRKTLEFEPLKYIVSTSLICFEKLKREIDRNKIKTLDDILNAIQIPRDSSRLFLDECIGTEDVKLPLVVDTKNKRKYKNESFPRGQVTVIQTLFQKNRIIKKLNKHHNMELPLNGVYKFIGQSRGRSATTTTIFEDISATTDLLEYPLSENVNILIKNSTEFVKQRLIEDRLFKLLSYSPREKSYNIIVDITHPDDL
ncbi:MAG: hypothetical protein ACXAB2_09860, partial [Candidatus Hodarchaeales archaeon]